VNAVQSPITQGAAPRRRPIPWVILLSAFGLILVTIIYLLPVGYMLLTSVKSSLEIAVNPLGLPRTLNFENYIDVYNRMNYLRAVLNTVFITAVSSIGIVLVSTLAAYPLARVQTRWSSAVYQYFSFGLMVPSFVVIIPLYSLMRSVGLLNTYAGLILIYIAFNIPFAVFFFTSFIRSLPKELEEAGLIDGCTPITVFWYIVLPLLRPVIGTVTMFITLSIWNDFLLPLVFLFDANSRTIMVNVYSFLGYYGFNPTTLFPAAALGSLPLLVFFFFLQRQIIAGITAGSVKG
jgi:raffinose/stachyose/melibiose transport system permease protein